MRRDGFTVIELMITSAILLLVMVYVTQAFTVQQKTYVVVDQVTEAQQNLRAVSDLVDRDVRLAGYMVPQQAAVCGHDATTGPDRLYLSNADAIRSVFALEGGNEDLAGDYGAPVSGVTSTWTRSGPTASIVLTRNWVDVSADGTDFAIGAGVTLVNRRDPEANVACGTITAITGNTLTVNLGGTSIGPVGYNADVVAVPAHVYSLTPASAGAPAQLFRDGMLIASDVEDLQVTYFFDLDDDLELDAGESFSTSGGTSAPWELSPANTRPDPSSLREVQLNLVTVTRDDDPNRDWALGAGEVTGNRTAGSLSGGDGKRRRVYTARVRPRNVIS
ncbi:MAG TPA: prepilin-type N-terminal cleavage/methylation domain-containing protein [Myxococcota bacterium]